MTHRIRSVEDQADTRKLSAVTQEFGDLLGLSSATSEDAPVVRLLHSVFEEALRVRASDIHIEPQERALRIRFRIDGVLHVQTEADAKIASAVALRLKLMSGLDISEKRLPQDGRFHVKLRAGTVDVRISTLPTQHGESVVMRLLTQDGGLLSLDKLDLPPAVARALRRAIARPSGMVLVTGPTGSGKTTTLYAALSALNTTGRKIITVGDPIEYRLPGVNQVQVVDKIELGFGRVLRAALRQDPDVILVGEMRDQTTAEIGLRAALLGTHRRPAASNAAHERRTLHPAAPDRHGRAALHGRHVAADGAGPAPGAHDLHALRHRGRARPAPARMAEVGTGRFRGPPPLPPRPRLPRLQRHRVCRSNRCLRVRPDDAGTRRDNEPRQPG